MCAGLTVFTALHIAQVPPTAHVAIVGIGGLGHIGLQFARAWGCHVTAISHTPVSFSSHSVIFVIGSDIMF